MALCTAGCTRYSKKWEQRVRKPHAFAVLWHSPLVSQNKRVLQKALSEHVSLEMQGNMTDFLFLSLPCMCGGGGSA